MDKSDKLPHETIDVAQQVRQLNDDWVKAMMRGDAETLDRIMADDFFFTYPLEGDDKAQFISDVTSGDLKIEHITREQCSVRVFGSTAVLTARDSATWLYHGNCPANIKSLRSLLSAPVAGSYAPFRPARC